MVSKEERVAEALKVAKLYYREGLSQNDIAESMSISRPTVSRLLSFALDSGLVRIEIGDPADDMNQLARDLERRYDLKRVIAVPTDVVAPANRLDAVGQEAARYIEGIVRDDDVIGIGWGRTVYAIGEHLAPKDVRGVTVVQVKGSASNTESNNYAFESANAFANAFRTVPQYLPLPVIFENARTKELVERETYIRRIADMGRRADIVVFTVGTVRDTAMLFNLGYLTAREQERLKRIAVGDVVSRFIDAEGRIADEDIDRRTIGIQLDDLKKVEHSVLTVASGAKVCAAHAAIVAGYANTLIADADSARQLLDFEG